MLAIAILGTEHAPSFSLFFSFDLELLDNISTCAYNRVVPTSPCLQSPTQEQARIEALIERLAADKALIGRVVLAALISLFTVIGQFLYVYLGLEAYADSFT